MKCGVSYCTTRNKEYLAVIDDGEKRFLLCKEHQISYAREQLDAVQLTTYSSQLEERECEICYSPAYVYADEVELHLCQKHLIKLLKKSLNPIEYKILYENHSEFQLIYEDVYTKDGYALQPID